MVSAVTVTLDDAALAVSYKPTAAQKRFIALMALGEAPEKSRKKLRISIERLQTWMMNPDFRAWRDSVLASEAREHVGEVRQALLVRARGGSEKAIELYLRAYDPEFRKTNDPNQTKNYYTQVVLDANKLS